METTSPQRVIIIHKPQTVDFAVISYQGLLELGEPEQITDDMGKLKMSQAAVKKIYPITSQSIQVITSVSNYSNKREVEGILDYVRSRTQEDNLICFMAKYVFEYKKGIREIYIQFHIDNPFFKRLRLILLGLNVTVNGSISSANSRDNRSFEFSGEAEPETHLATTHSCMPTVSVSKLGEFQEDLLSTKLTLKASVNIRWTGSAPEPLYLQMPQEKMEILLKSMLPLGLQEFKIVLKNGAVRSCNKVVIMQGPSPKLKHLLSSGNNELILENMEEPVADILLKYLFGYKQPVSHISWETIADILQVAIDYEISCLQLNLEDGVILKQKDDLMVDTAIRLFKEASRVDTLLRLQTYLTCVIGRYPDHDIWASPELQGMSDMQRHNLLQKIEQSKQLQ